MTSEGMPSTTWGLDPTPAGKAAADRFLDLVKRGHVPPEDVAYFRDVLEQAGIRVLFPPHPGADEDGWFEIHTRRCGRPACACGKPGGRRHGPYVIWRWREGGRRRAEHLGRLGKAKIPERRRAALEDAVRRHEAREMGFLHDD